jgi:uncharacterized membrane protein HdeD (DUF308 family)
LGALALFLPALALEYFAGTSNNIQEQSLVNFVGIYQMAFGIMGCFFWKSSETNARKAWFLMTAFLTILAICIIIYNKSVRMIPVGETYMVDLAIWATMAAGSLYFRSKE